MKPRINPGTKRLNIGRYRNPNRDVWILDFADLMACGCLGVGRGVQVESM